MTLQFETLVDNEIAPHIPAIAGLRIRIFRDWPYLYDGDQAYEQRYLRSYAATTGAVIVLARDGAQVVGAATGMPLEAHADDFAAAMPDLDPKEVFYCAESVLLPRYRGQGAGHRFFDVREAQARVLGRRWVMFCGVLRPADHPARPADYVPLNGFWEKRGYAPVAGAVARFNWRDVGETRQTEKPLQVWMKDLQA